MLQSDAVRGDPAEAIGKERAMHLCIFIDFRIWKWRLRIHLSRR
jgi:hypothetical protein